MRSLVVDDSPTIRILLQHLLSSYGDCDVAQNGHEAIDAFSRGLSEGRPYDLICLDLAMPYSDGLAVLSKVRAAEARSHPGVRARVIVVTASREPARMQKAVERGADACLLKPVVTEQLIQYLTDFGLLRNPVAPLYGEIALQVQQLCEADTIPIGMLVRLIHFMADSIDRQSAAPQQ